MFNSNIDAFGNNTMTERKELLVDLYFTVSNHLPNTFVYNDTNSMSSNVENTTCFTMIESMWHTFLYGTIALVNEQIQFRSSH